jgi:Flp pilus assembly pilin Flp
MQIVNMLVVRVQNAWFSAQEEESGQTLVEYALIIAVVALGVLGALYVLKNSINGIFGKTSSTLNNGV